MSEASAANDEVLPPTLAEALIADNFDQKGGVLTVGGIEVSDLAKRFGTPLFVYDSMLLRRNLRRLRDAVGGRVDIHYSVKANPNPAVISIFVAEGAGLEIASAAEYLRAIKAGGTPERIVFAGPGKAAEELDFVIERGIGEIHLETDIELEMVAAIGERLGQCVPVGLRVNPSSAAQGGAMRMGGKPAPFGFDEERLVEIIAEVRKRPTLAFKGIHLFAGTQILDADVLETQWRHAIELARRIQTEQGVLVETIDLGGGLGVPYFKGEQNLDLERLSQLAPPLFAEAASTLPSTRIILEPGRYLAASAGLYLTRVRAAKHSRDQIYAVIDGGMHHHLAASGNLGQVIKKDYPIVLAGRLDAPAEVTASVVGPLCTPLDTLGRKVRLPMPETGDLVAVLQSGAYGLSASPVGFLSHPMPAEVLIDEGEARLIRERGSFEQPITPLP
ncbi:MAG: type III PLP-dependent enzyme [Alphaproteobacteria bacterium GM202ARS2]|nr:type III PLP-dependent enzyme [Alphaproteobacteria bacterium GM202ARS2]